MAEYFASLTTSECRPRRPQPKFSRNCSTSSPDYAYAKACVLITPSASLTSLHSSRVIGHARCAIDCASMINTHFMEGLCRRNFKQVTSLGKASPNNLPLLEHRMRISRPRMRPRNARLTTETARKLMMFSLILMYQPLNLAGIRPPSQIRKDQTPQARTWTSRKINSGSRRFRFGKGCISSHRTPAPRPQTMSAGAVPARTGAFYHRSKGLRRWAALPLPGSSITSAKILSIPPTPLR
ncbi:hypothetical protein AWB76_07609 [Caballeronia temeraria]|uniref:Uncharacterized protein n=1 Tax=Caballeronia temeraria TaxID=1777137 RepID=A0A158DWF3_9BURK|nr:hypothetical protein AWB76_07609 [Caballeronia temeraria]